MPAGFDPRSRLDEVLNWLRDCESADHPLVPCQSDMLPRNSVLVTMASISIGSPHKAIEEAARATAGQSQNISVPGIQSIEVLLPANLPPSFEQGLRVIWRLTSTQWCCRLFKMGSWPQSTAHSINGGCSIWTQGTSTDFLFADNLWSGHNRWFA